MRFPLLLTLVALLVCSTTTAFAPTSPRWFASPPSRLKMSSAEVEPRDVKVQEVLAFAREIGPIGVDAPQEDQDKLFQMSQDLLQLSDPNPSDVPLRGIHDMVYSASAGSSSGKLFGPVYGTVKQEFLEDNETFINSVECGPLLASLRATRTTKNESTSLVKFHETKIQVFGQTVLDKKIKGGGYWKYFFMGTIVDADGTKKFVRIMETPSLFVLEQAL